MTPTGAPECYEIVAVLGSGGWAEVYVGRSRGLSRHLVALKLLRQDAQLRADGAHRFRREVEIGFHLNHPHIAAARAETEIRGFPTLVLELVGPSVDAARAQIVGDFPAVRQIARQVLRGLTYLEKQRVAHRDLSLGNLLIDPRGDIRIIDFGVATRDDGSISPGPVGATWPYISPELLRRERGAPASDAFSLGALLFELATGQVPFGSNRAQVMSGHARGAPPLPRSVPRDLRRVIRGLLAQDPRGRLCPEEALAMLGPDDPRVAGRLGAISRAWFRRQCPELTHPLEAADLAIAAPSARPVRRWRRHALIALSATAACVGVAVWMASDDAPTEPTPHQASLDGSMSPPRDLPSDPTERRPSSAAAQDVEDEAESVEEDRLTASRTRARVPDQTAVSGPARNLRETRHPGNRDKASIAEAAEDAAKAYARAIREHGKDNVRLLTMQNGAVVVLPGRWHNNQLTIPLRLFGVQALKTATLFTDSGDRWKLTVRHHQGERWSLVVVRDNGVFTGTATLFLIFGGEITSIIEGVVVQ